ncbi:hypothetical protein TruAng_005891 [Truncatella angustata]|nr:hypothetical protein TruAng_005891 [Truncatella angustata]
MPPDSATKLANTDGAAPARGVLEETDHWIKVKKRPLRTQTTSSPSPPEVGIGTVDPSDTRMSQDLLTEATNVLLTRWASQIFEHGFDAIFNPSIGRYGCPFVTLDACMDEEMHHESPGHDSASVVQGHNSNRPIEVSLDLAVHAFVAQWLPLVLQTSPVTQNQIEDQIRETWRAARMDMLKIINRVSYRSVLSLYLFSQTPIPIGIAEDEVMEGISNMMCHQTALLQVQRLRERQKGSRLLGSEVLPLKRIPTPSVGVSQTFLDLESRVYWAVIMWDTSSSLTSNFRASLTSGLKGACSEPAWRLVRAYLVGSFIPRTDPWRADGFEVTDETASQTFSAATICIIYTFKTITSLKEALREGVDEDDVFFAWKAFLDAFEIFKTSIRPLLSLCEKHLQFLGQERRLSWYKLNLVYNLGILVLFDALEAAHRSDLLAQVADAGQDAEHESLNILKFGLENKYRINTPASDSSTRLRPTRGSAYPIGVSLVAIDPFPHHVVDLVILMTKVILRNYRDNIFDGGVYSNLSSILQETLAQLPQSSKFVQDAQEYLQLSFAEHNLSPSLDENLNVHKG